MLRRALVVGGVLAAALAPAASAQVGSGPCSGSALRGAQCGTLAVPLDHRAPVEQGGETLTLNYARFPARGARRGTVVLLSGGPGQAAISFAGALTRGPLRFLRP